MKRLRGLRKYENGLSLFEVMAAMVIMSMIVAGTVSMQANEARDKFADHAATMSIRVQNAARTHRAETGSWPTGTAQLVAAGRLTAAEATSPFNTSYSFSVTGNNLRISANATNSTYARRLSGILPGGSSSGSSYSFQFPPAGSEVSLAGLYKRDGSEGLTGSMNANGNSINNVNTVNATNVNATNGNLTSLSASTIQAANSIYSNGTITANGTLASNTGISTPGNVNAGGTVSASHLHSNGNIYAVNEIQGANINSRGGMYAQGQITAAGHLRSEADISAANAISGNYLKSYGNLGVDGTADVRRLNVSENIYNPGYMYSRRYADYDNPNTFMHLAGTSRLSDLEVLGQLRVSQAGTSVGSSCSSGGISFNSSQQLMTCKNGAWETIKPEVSTTLAAFRGDADIGNLHIRQMQVALNRKQTADFYYPTPIPAGAFITCTATNSWVLGNRGWGEPYCNCDNNKCRVVNTDDTDSMSFFVQVIGIRG